MPHAIRTERHNNIGSHVTFLPTQVRLQLHTSSSEQKYWIRNLKDVKLYRRSALDVLEKEENSHA